MIGLAEPSERRLLRWGGLSSRSRLGWDSWRRRRTRWAASDFRRRYHVLERRMAKLIEPRSIPLTPPV